MTVESALSDLLKAGHKAEFTSAGGMGTITEKEGRRFSFYSFSGFEAQANKLKAASVAEVNAKKYVSGLRLIVSAEAPPEYRGREAKIEAFDRGDNTVFVRFTTPAASGRPVFAASSAWISVDRVRLLPFAVKDLVTIVECDEELNGEKGIIVTDQSSDPNDSQPYLVYVYGQDDTVWLSAAELKAYEG